MVANAVEAINRHRKQFDAEIIGTPAGEIGIIKSLVLPETSVGLYYRDGQYVVSWREFPRMEDGEDCEIDTFKKPTDAVRFAIVHLASMEVSKLAEYELNNPAFNR